VLFQKSEGGDGGKKDRGRRAGGRRESEREREREITLSQNEQVKEGA